MLSIRSRIPALTAFFVAIWGEIKVSLERALNG